MNNLYGSRSEHTVTGCNANLLWLRLNATIVTAMCQNALKRCLHLVMASFRVLAGMVARACTGACLELARNYVRSPA